MAIYSACPFVISNIVICLISKQFSFYIHIYIYIAQCVDDGFDQCNWRHGYDCIGLRS